MILEEPGPDIIGIVICRESASKCQVADNKIEWPGRTDRHRRERRGVIRKLLNSAWRRFYLSLASQSNILHCSLHIYHIKREDSEILSIEHKIYISWRRWGGLTLKIAGPDLSWELFHLQFLEFKHFLVFFVLLLRETKRNVGWTRWPPGC